MSRRLELPPIWARPSATGSSGTEKGWRVFVTTDMAEVPLATDRGRGVIGVDLNADHLAVAETEQ